MNNRHKELITSGQSDLFAGNKDTEELAQDNWEFRPGHHMENSREDQFWMDVGDRPSVSANGELFKNSAEKKRISKTYSEQQAFTDWIKRALFHNDETVFKQFYSSHPDSPQAFNLYKIWSQPAIGKFKSILQKTARNLIEADETLNTNSNVQLDCQFGADLRVVDGKVKLFVRYYDFSITHQMIRGKNLVPSTTEKMPGDLFVEIELKETSLRVQKFSASNALIADLTTTNVVNVPEWLRRAKALRNKSKVTESDINRVADSMRRENYILNAKLQKQHEITAAKTKQLREERKIQDEQKAAVESGKLSAYLAAIEKMLLALGEPATNEEKRLKKMLEEIMEQKGSIKTRLASIEDGSLNDIDSILLIAALQSGLSDDFLNELHHINNVRFPWDADKLKYALAQENPAEYVANEENKLSAARSAERLKPDTPEQILRNSQNKEKEAKEQAERVKQLNEAAAQATTELLAQEQQAKVEAIKTLCETTIKQYLEKLVPDITVEIAEKNPDLATFFSKQPLDEPVYDASGQQKIITTERGIDLLASGKISSDAVIPNLSESARTAFYKYQTLKQIEKLVNEEGVSDSEKLTNVTKKLVADRPLLEKNRDPISSTFLKIIDILLPKAAYKYLATSALFKTKSMQTAENVERVVNKQLSLDEIKKLKSDMSEREKHKKPPTRAR